MVVVIQFARHVTCVLKSNVRTVSINYTIGT